MNRYEYVVRTYPTLKVIKDKLYSIDAIGIGIRDIESNIVYPSPLTNFIKSNFRSKNGGSISSQSNAAYTVTLFLNYCRDMINQEIEEFLCLKEQGIYGLTLKHGALFITDLSIRSREGELKSNTVRERIAYLNRFYAWLKEQDLIKENITVTYHDKYDTRNKNEYQNIRMTTHLQDMFDKVELGTVYPPKKTKTSERLSDFGKNRVQLLKEFLDVAKDVSPDIYLGICLQFFGGFPAAKSLKSF